MARSESLGAGKTITFLLLGVIIFICKKVSDQYYVCVNTYKTKHIRTSFLSFTSQAIPFFLNISFKSYVGISKS